MQSGYTIGSMSTVAVIDDFYTPAQAAAIIGVSHAQVTRYVHNGLLQAERIGPQLLLPKPQVHKFKRPPRGNPAFRSQKRGAKKIR